MFSTTLDLFGLLALLSFCICLVITAVFIVHNKWSGLSNRMLIFALLSMAGACLLALAIYDSAPGPWSGLVLLMSANTLLIVPFSLLYLQKWPAGSWHVADYLHFVPALLYLVYGLISMPWAGFVVAYALSGGIGQQLNYFRIPQWLVYSILMIHASRGLASRAGHPSFTKCPVWLKAFVGSFVITAVVPVLVAIQNNRNGDVLFFGFVIATAFVACLYVLLNPAILYGAYAVVPPVQLAPGPGIPKPGSLETADELYDDDTTSGEPVTGESSKPKRISLSDEQIEFMHKRLQEFMLIRKPFLHQKYTLQQLSSDSGFPLYQLSLYLNRTLGMNFNSYINKMRIDFLLESYKRNQDKWNRYTLEAVAREIGFSNRTSFIQAFKKNTGTNPSVYFKNIHGHILND